MEPDVSSGAEHLLRAVRDARLPDAEIERRVARKNAVVAHALQAHCLPLAVAEDLLYHPELRDAIERLRPACVAARAILENGCALASLEDRLLKWSPEYEPLLAERFAFLLLCGQRVLAPGDLVETLRRRPALTADEVDLAAALGETCLVPVLLRTLTADLSDWPARERHALLSRALGALAEVKGHAPLLRGASMGIGPARTERPLEGVPRSSGQASAGKESRSSAALLLGPGAILRDDGPELRARGLPPGDEIDLEAQVERWRRWWAAEGSSAFLDPIDALPDRPHAPPLPVLLLPEGGGEYTLDPPAPFFYLGRRGGRPEIVSLRPRQPEPTTWRARLTRAAAALLEENEPEAVEYEGVCALEGHHVHPSRPDEGLLLAIPDPDLAVAWLTCTECGQAGYVRYALSADDLPPA
jgi:hypothetical protein